MTNMATVEIKAVAPAKAFELSQRFCVDLGFALELLLDDPAYFHAGRCGFLLQHFYVKDDESVQQAAQTDQDEHGAPV